MFSFTTCFIFWHKNYQLNKNNKHVLSLINELDEYKKVVVELEVINNEGLNKKDIINTLNDRVDSLNKEVDVYNNNISRLNKELGIK